MVNKPIKITINILLKKGDKVTVTEESLNSGYNSDKEKATLYLKVGGVYTIDYTEIGNWYTSVYLKEFPGIAFNSVHFEEVKKVDIQFKSFYKNEIEFNEHGLTASKEMEEAISKIYTKWLNAGFNPSECKELFLTQIWQTCTFINVIRNKLKMNIKEE